MIILFTCSGDGTSDLVAKRLGPKLFRFNYDLINQYKIIFTPHNWLITDPTGRSIDSTTCTKAFWWKAFSAINEAQDKMIIAENKYVFRDLYGLLYLQGKVLGNPSNWHDRYGKLTILSIAKRYFQVPQTLVTMGLAGSEVLCDRRVVAKSLSSSLTADKKALFTTPVEVQKLHPGYLWYLQEQIDSKWDVTVFLCHGKTFAFRRDRSELKGIDWRAEQTFDINSLEWETCDLKPEINNAILSLSMELGVQFGRYDFMSIGDTEGLVFLEFNANGQWVFLDYHNKYGLLDCFIDWLNE